MDLSELGTTLERIDTRTASNEERLARIEREVAKPSLTLREVCEQYLQRSESYVRARPWMVPEPDIPGRPSVWWRRTLEEYYSVPLDVRREQFYQSKRAQRRSRRAS